MTKRVVGEPGQTIALAIRSAEAWEGASRQPVQVQIESGRLAVTGAAIAWRLWTLGAVVLECFHGPDNRYYCNYECYH